jgi:uncharacterized membrane protein YgcG
MSDDVTQLALVVGATTLINVSHAASQKTDTVVPIVAGGLTFSGLAVAGGLFKRYELFTALAWLFLISALVFRGGPLLTSGSALVSSAKTRVTTGGPASNSSKSGAKGKGYSGGGGGGGGGGGV